MSAKPLLGFAKPLLGFAEPEDPTKLVLNTLYASEANLSSHSTRSSVQMVDRGGEHNEGFWSVRWHDAIQKQRAGAQGILTATAIRPNTCSGALLYTSSEPPARQYSVTEHLFASCTRIAMTWESQYGDIQAVQWCSPSINSVQMDILFSTKKAL